MTRPMWVHPHLLSTPPRQADVVFAHETDGDDRRRTSNRLLIRCAAPEHRPDPGNGHLRVKVSDPALIDAHSSPESTCLVICQSVLIVSLDAFGRSCPTQEVIA